MRIYDIREQKDIITNGSIVYIELFREEVRIVLDTGYNIWITRDEIYRINKEAKEESFVE